MFVSVSSISLIIYFGFFPLFFYPDLEPKDLLSCIPPSPFMIILLSLHLDLSQGTARTSLSASLSVFLCLIPYVSASWHPSLVTYLSLSNLLVLKSLSLTFIPKYHPFFTTKNLEAYYDKRFVLRTPTPTHLILKLLFQYFEERPIRLNKTHTDPSSFLPSVLHKGWKSPFFPRFWAWCGFFRSTRAPGPGRARGPPA